MNFSLGTDVDSLGIGSKSKSSPPSCHTQQVNSHRISSVILRPETAHASGNHLLSHDQHTFLLIWQVINLHHASISLSASSLCSIHRSFFKKRWYGFDDALYKGASRYAKQGSVITHIGLQDNQPRLDIWRMTLQEITFIGNYIRSGGAHPSLLGTGYSLSGKARLEPEPVIPVVW